MAVPPPLPSENPYAAPDAPVDDPAAVEMVLADRVARLAAAIVDGVILIGPAILLAVLVPVLLPQQQQSGSELALGVVSLLVIGSMVVVLVVNAVMLHRSGQTIGKRLLSIRIVLADGNPCSLLRVIFARWLPVTLMGLIPILGYVIGLIDVLLIFREDHRCMHDHIAGTIVVRA